MLTIVIPLTEEGWDEEKEEFLEPKTIAIQLEHSLVSISKWEAKWHKAFLNTKELTDEETIDYIRYMTLNKNVDPIVYQKLTRENINEIVNYIRNPMSATKFFDDKNSKASREVVTSELIYYWMFSMQIPIECERWHINRLMALIRIFSIKNAPPKKMSKNSKAQHYASLNAARRKKYGTRG